MRKLPTFERACPTCGRAFTTNASKVARGRGRYCSKACSAKANSTRHGHTTKHTASPTYHTWINMVARCTRPSAARYKDYGARGITVCDRWLSFDNFLADMGERPEGRTLDRIDGTRGYDPGNCRWATPFEQSTNLRTNLNVTFRGETMPLAVLSRRLGVKKGTLLYRIERGWSDDAIATPAKYGDRSRS